MYWNGRQREVGSAAALGAVAGCVSVPQPVSVVGAFVGTATTKKATL